MTLKTFTIIIQTSDSGYRKIVDWLNKHKYGSLSAITYNNLNKKYILKQKVKDALAKECDCYTADEDYTCSACRIGKELFGDEK